jgi:amino acid transporter
VARELQREGYNASVIARKLIELHGAPRAEAEALIGQLFGRPVNAFAGARFQALAPGLFLCALALSFALFFVSRLGARLTPRLGMVYGALGLVAVYGLAQAIAAARAAPR